MSENPVDEQEGFLTRWSRRKARARQGEALPEPGDEADEGPQEAADDAEATAPPAERPATAGEDTGSVTADPDVELPPLDTLGEDSDYSAFLGKGVPTDLRKKALRKLFHSPKFNLRDGLDDYDWDFSNPEPLGEIVTAEMRYRLKRELERLAGLDEDEEKPEDSPTVAAAASRDSAEHDESDDRVDPEADDDQPEPS